MVPPPKLCANGNPTDEHEAVSPAATGYIFVNVPSEKGVAFHYYDFVAKTYKPFMRPYLYRPVADMRETTLLASGVSTDDAGVEYASLMTLVDGTSETIIYATSTVKTLQEPQLTQSGDRYLFVVPPQENETVVQTHPNQWSIYLGETHGDKKALLIAHGNHARFSPDGKSILYFGDDGLHLYNIETGTSRAAFAMSDDLAFATLAVSNDGTLLAISNPKANTIRVYTIASWDPANFKLNESYIFNLTGFWPVFSPDGSKIAFEQIDWNTSQQAENARLSLIDLAAQETPVEVLADWNAFDASKITISDWVTAN